VPVSRDPLLTLPPCAPRPSVVLPGKSTVLRALAAAALVGSVGLAVPAERGSCLPLLDAVMLRTFSGDAPQEGLSAYGVEMTEMA
jgi:DNA mismatch repair ATPase MutS